MATVLVNRGSTIKDLYDSNSPAGKLHIISELLSLGIMSEIEIKLMLDIKVTSLELAMYGVEK